MLGFPVDEEEQLNTIIDINDQEGDYESGDHKRRKKKHD